MLKIINKISIFFLNMKIRRKLLLLYFLLGCIPLGGLSGYLLYQSESNIYGRYAAQVTASSARVKSVLFDITYFTGRLSDLLVFDTDLYQVISQQYISADELYDAYRDYQTINSMQEMHSQFSSIRVYVNNDTMVSAGSYVVVNDDIRQKHWYKAAEQSTGSIIWINDSDIDKNSNLHLVRKIVLPNNKGFAVLVMSISDNYIKLMIGENQTYNILGICEDEIFYSNYSNEIGEQITDEITKGKERLRDTYEFIYNGMEVLAYRNTLKAVGGTQTFEFITMDSNAVSDVRTNRLFIIIISGISIFVPLLLMLIYTSYFSRRVNTLRIQMNRVAAGDYEIADSFSGEDELRELFRDMQFTIQNIKQLDKKIYEEKLDKEKLLNYQQKMNFEILSNQINPHFLFNTLETIRMEAMLNEQKKITNMIKNLGSLLRYSLQTRNKMVTLKSELDNVETYLEIQHFRFEDKISYSIVVKDRMDLNKYEIIPFLIQPLVENSFVHGLENKKGTGEIRIVITEGEHCLRIQVEDNGVGMRPDQLDELIRFMKDNNVQESNKIGVRNVYQRLRLFYKDAFHMEIKSVCGEGTWILLELPTDLVKKSALREEGDQNESDDH